MNNKQPNRHVNSAVQHKKYEEQSLTSYLRQLRSDDYSLTKLIACTLDLCIEESSSLSIVEYNS